MTKLGSQKIHICPKVTRIGSIIAHRIDYNGVGNLREASGTNPAKINPSTPPREIATLQKEAIKENLKTNYKASEG